MAANEWDVVEEVNAADVQASNVQTADVQPDDPWAVVDEVDKDSLVEGLGKVVENTPTRFKQSIGGLIQAAGDPAEVGGVAIRRLAENKDPSFFEKANAGLSLAYKLPGILLDKSINDDSAVAKAKQFMAEKGAEIYSSANEELASNQPNVDGAVQQFALDVSRGIIDMGPALAAGFVTRNPATTLGIMGGQVGGQVYGERKAEGGSSGDASSAAVFHALAEVIPESIPVAALLKRGSPFLKRMFDATVGEGGQEFVTSALQQSYDLQSLEGMSLKDAMQNIDWSEAAYSGAVGVGVGGGLAIATQPFAGKENTQEDGFEVVDEQPISESPIEQSSPLQDTANELSPKTARLRERILANRAAQAQEQAAAQERDAAFASREAELSVDDAQVREDMLMQQDQPRYLNKLQRDDNRLPGKIDIGEEQVNPFEIVSERPLDEPAQQVLNQEAPANNVMADALGPVADKMQGDKLRAERLPANLKDPRLAREDYRAPLQQMSDDLTKGGGVALIGGQFSEMNQGKPATQVDDPIRTSSINPEWFQNMTAPAVDGSAVDTGYSVKDTQRAVNKALEGKLLGKREKRVIEYMLDQVEADRTSPDNIDYARDTQDVVRQKIAKPLPRGEIARLITESPDTDFQPGSRYEETEYNPDWDAETRSLSDLAREAFEVDPAGYDALIEHTDSMSDYALAQEIIKFTKEAKNATPQATQTEKQADAVDTRQDDSGREGRPRAEETDILGDNTRTAQALKDAEIAQDNKRNPNKDVPADQGVAGDLFSQDANKQVDIEDASQEPSQDIATPPVSSDVKPEKSSQEANQAEPNQSTSISAQEIDKSPPDKQAETSTEKAAPSGAVSTSTPKKPDILTPVSKRPEPTTEEIQKVLSESEIGKRGKAQEKAAQDKADALTPASKRSQAEKITDFGEKIGGARKDLGIKSSKKGDTKGKQKGWRSRYRVVQIVGEQRMNRSTGKYEDGPNNGKWVALDSRKKAKRFGSMPRPIGNKYFDTEAEANATLPLMAVAEKHRVYTQGDKFAIYRNVTDRKRVRVSPELFDSRDDAMRYLAEHADEILATKTSFGEEILPKPEKVYRSGEARRDGDIDDAAFDRVFGFRGVEFGNWNNQEERQEVMNHAYDSLLDLAEALNIPPEAVSLNGELALAFGARGQGLSGAAAHYEPSYAVINLTKMSGAGHLAHEWLHALDHYLARQDGKSSSEKTGSKRGGEVYKTKDDRRDMASHGFQYESRTKVRKELREAFDHLMTTMLTKAETYVEDTQHVENFLGRARDELEKKLNNVRDNLSRQLDIKYYKRKNKPATDQQLSRYDELAAMLINGENTDVELRMNPQKNTGRRSGSLGTYRNSNDIIDEMSGIYKAVRGRAGFSDAGDNTMGSLSNAVNYYGQRIKMMKSAESGEKKVKKIPTQFRMRAKEADQGRTGEYWATEHELAARAFAAYMEDKLNEGDAGNNFLVYHAHGAILAPVYPDGLFRPYPEGKERTAINAAFDNLFKVIKTKKTDKGTALFSRNSKKESTSLSAVELDAVVSRIAPFLKAAKGVTVVDTFNDLPAAIQKDAQKQGAGDGDVEGVFHKGKVYLVRDAIVSVEHAETVLFHELTHRGMDVIYGNKGVNIALNKLYLAIGGSKGLNRIANELGINLKEYRKGLSATYPDGTPKYSKALRTNILVEELIAHEGELKPTIRKRIRELIGAIKEWLRNHGMKWLAGNYGASDISALAKKARKAGTTSKTADGPTRFMSTGERDAALSGQPLFSKKSEAATNALPEESRAQQIWETLVFKAQDKFAPLLKVQRQAEKKQGVNELPEDQDAYLAELRYHGITGAKIEDFHEDHVQPLLDAIHKAGLSLEEVGEALHARHAAEANAQLKKINPDREDNDALSGMSNAEAVNVIQGFKDRGQLDAMEDIANRVDAITKSRRDLLRESGLETDETIAAWEDAYKYYIPLQREGKGGNLPRKGKGFDTRGKEKRRTGSNLDVANVLAQVVAQHEATIIRSEKAKVGKALMEFVKANPNESLYTVDKPDYKPTFDKDGLVVYRPDTSYVLADNVLSVRVDGEEHHVTFNEKSVDAMRIARSMKNLGAQDAGVIVNALLKVNRWLALVNTSANPEFVISNFARDMQTAGYNLNDTEAANMKKAIFKDVGKSWRGIRSAQKGRNDQVWAKHFREFRDAGGKTGWMDHYRDIDQREAKLKKLLREMQPGKMMTIKRGLNNLMKFIEDENTAVENAVRLSAFVHARKAGISEAKAAKIAKELTVNFNRKGDSGQVLNALYLFYNASIQGSVRMILAARKSSKVRKLMVGTVAFAMMLDMLNRSLGGDDDDGEPRYDKIPGYTKAHNLIVMRPGGDYFKIPLPWGYNVMHVTGQVLGEAMSKKGFNPSDGAMRVLGSVVGAFNPIGGEESLLQMVSPTITDPFVQWGENKDFAGRPLRPADNPFGVDKPNSQKYWGSVREPSRYIAEQLNKLTGGDAVRPGAIDVSPEFFDLIYDTATGGAGRFLGDTVATPIKILQKDEIETYTVPLVRKLYGTQNPRRMVSTYYKNMEDIRLVENQIKFYREDPEKRQSVKNEYNAQYRLIGRAKQYQSQIRKLRKKRNQIKNTKKLTDQERKLKLQPIEDRINLVMTKFNKLYREKVVLP